MQNNNSLGAESFHVFFCVITYRVLPVSPWEWFTLTSSFVLESTGRANPRQVYKSFSKGHWLTGIGPPLVGMAPLHNDQDIKKLEKKVMVFAGIQFLLAGVCLSALQLQLSNCKTQFLHVSSRLKKKYSSEIFHNFNIIIGVMNINEYILYNSCGKYFIDVCLYENFYNYTYKYMYLCYTVGWRNSLQNYSRPSTSDWSYRNIFIAHNYW